MKYTIAGYYGDDDNYSYQKSKDEQVIDLLLQNKKNQLTCGIHKALRELEKIGVFPTDTGLDLLILAAHVQAADTRLSREKTSQDNWTRELGMVIPVKEPALWQKTIPVLQQILNFLTGDVWNIAFRSRPKHVNSLKESVSESEYNRLSLFSGGLDSLIGSINTIDAEHKTLLVSHAGDTATKHAQSLLFQGLSKTYPHQKFDHFNLWLNITKKIFDNIGKENSTRGRSFLFFATGVFCGTGFNKPFTLDVPENGLIALNVPLDKLRLGALSTRTTHPFYIARWNDLLQTLGIPGQIENPFWSKTKGEMVKGCANQDLLHSLIPDALSCASPAKGRYVKMGHIKHCGYCLPCLIRRAAIEEGLGRGNDPTEYLKPDLTAHTLNTLKAEGQQIRSFQYAISRLKKDPSLANILIHKPGSLSDEPQNWTALADVYSRGLNEVSKLLTGVKTAAL